MEKSDRVLGKGRRDSVHRDWVQLDIGDEGWAIHIDGSLQYRGRVMVP